MTMPIGNPYIVLMERTIENLNYIHGNVSVNDRNPAEVAPELYEITQAINSFLGVLLMPWERVFNMKALNGYSNKPHKLKPLGLDMLKSSKPDEDEDRPHLGSMLTSLRHGAAHGGITILDWREYRMRCPKEIAPVVKNDHIAAIEIESKSDNGDGPRNWGCVFNIDDLVKFLRAAQRLSTQEEYVLPDVWKEHQRALRQIQRMGAS